MRFMLPRFSSAALLTLWLSTTGLAATVYDQGVLNFTKEVGTDAAVNRDCITPTVCLTRGFIGPIINGVTNGVMGIRWAKGNIADWPSLNYGLISQMDGRTIFAGNPGDRYVLHLIADDIYLEVSINWFSIGRESGSAWPGMPSHSGTWAGFSYTRTTTNASFQPPLITRQPSEINVIVGHPVHLDVMAIGATGYQWRKDDIDLVGQVFPMISSPSANFLDSGLYSVVVSNANGSVTSQTARLGVWNGLVAKYPFSETFEPSPVTGTWKAAPYFSVYRFNPSGIIAVTSLASPGYCGAGAGWMAATAGIPNLNEVIFPIDLTNVTGAYFSFRHGLLEDPLDPEYILPEVHQGHAAGNGVSVSADGTTWHKVQGLTTTEGALRNAFKTFKVNLDSVVAAKGLTYGLNFKFKLQQSGTPANARNGHCYDDIQVSPQIP